MRPLGPKSRLIENRGRTGAPGRLWKRQNQNTGARAVFAESRSVARRRDRQALDAGDAARRIAMPGITRARICGFSGRARVSIAFKPSLELKAGMASRRSIELPITASDRNQATVPPGEDIAL